MADLAIIAGAIAAVSLVRTRISRWPVSTAMLFVAVGVVLGTDVTGALDLELRDESIALLVELTLGLLLFADATRIELGRGASFGIPVRLLAIGLPLTIGLGAVMTALLLTDLSWAEAALVAAILAPTDAALGEAVVTNPSVPVRIRQALNIESGLNDGLVVPVVTVFAALAVGEELGDPAELMSEAVAEIAIGVAIGAVVAVLLVALVRVAMQRRWTDAEGLRLVALGGALVAFGATDALGGSGFVAAFVCGLLARRLAGESLCERVELVEDLGQLGAAATFLIFGAVMVWPAFEQVTPLVLICAVGTLTVGRMLPVAVAMIGSGLRPPTIVFLGWFGPRGLASMVFGLLIVADPDLDRSDDLFAVIVVVVVLSVVLHGATAAPGARRYGAWYERSGGREMMPAESMDVPIGRTRSGGPASGSVESPG